MYIIRHIHDVFMCSDWNLKTQMNCLISSEVQLNDSPNDSPSKTVKNVFYFI